VEQETLQQPGNVENVKAQTLDGKKESLELKSNSFFQSNP